MSPRAGAPRNSDNLPKRYDRQDRHASSPRIPATVGERQYLRQSGRSTGFQARGVIHRLEACAT